MNIMWHNYELIWFIQARKIWKVAKITVLKWWSSQPMQPYLSDPMILAISYYSTKLHYLRFGTPCQENTPNHPLNLCGALSSQVLVNQCVCQTRSLVFFSHFLHKLFASRQPKCWHGSVKYVYSFLPNWTKTTLFQKREKGCWVFTSSKVIATIAVNWLDWCFEKEYCFRTEMQILKKILTCCICEVVEWTYIIRCCYGVSNLPSSHNHKVAAWLYVNLSTVFSSLLSSKPKWVSPT